CFRQLMMLQTQFEMQTAFMHLPHALYERTLYGEPGRVVLNVISNPLDESQGADRVEFAGDICTCCQLHPSDDTLDSSVEVCQLRNPLGLAQCAVRMCVTLHKNHPPNRQFRRCALVVPQMVGSVKH